MMREPLLERNPDFGPVDLPLLVGIANAIEREAAARYATLARIMAASGGAGPASQALAAKAGRMRAAPAEPAPR